jgi:hypothetical protein
VEYFAMQVGSQLAMANENKTTTIRLLFVPLE